MTLRYFKSILSALWRYPAFRLFWDQAHLAETDASMDDLIYEYHHPNFGPLRCMVSTSTSVTKLGELYWMMYIPMNERTTRVFEELVRRYGREVVRLAPWPRS
jgi:hypothetical protein